MEDALRAATHPHDFKLLVAVDGQRHVDGRHRPTKSPLRPVEVRRRWLRQRQAPERRLDPSGRRPAAPRAHAPPFACTVIVTRYRPCWASLLQFVKYRARIGLRWRHKTPVPSAPPRTWSAASGRSSSSATSPRAARRFCELERSLSGISPRTLSLRLRALEEEGILVRKTFPEVPPRVEYSLTRRATPCCR